MWHMETRKNWSKGSKLEHQKLGLKTKFYIDFLAVTFCQLIKSPVLGGILCVFIMCVTFYTDYVREVKTFSYNFNVVF